MSNYTSGTPVRPVSFYVKVVVGVLLALIVLIGGCNYMASFDAPRPGYAAVCQTGGPIQGDSGTCGVMQRGSGKTNIGFQNRLVEFPATQRNYLIGDRGDNSVEVTVPTADGIPVSVQGQARFTLNTDEKALLGFYKGFGTRTFGGPSAVDNPDGWWVSFLDNNFRPTLEGALREEILNYRCADLNPSCDLSKLNQQIEDAAVGDTTGEKQDGRKANQNLSLISEQIGKKLDSDLQAALGGRFLNNVTFKLTRINPPGSLLGEISRANSAKARLITARANARAQRESAIGEANAKREEAKGIKALNDAYKNSKAKAQIDAIKALCGEQGCQNLTVLGGSSQNLLNVGGK